MIDFSKVSEIEMNELKNIISKSVEKSELEQYYLFTIDPIQKAKIFILCYRFLLNVYNLVEDGELRTEVKKVIDNSIDKYILLNKYLEELPPANFRRHKFRNDILKHLDRDVDDLVDLFSVLTEKVNVVQISRLKGIIMEGKSGQEFKKILGDFSSQ